MVFPGRSLDARFFATPRHPSQCRSRPRRRAHRHHSFNRDRPSAPRARCPAFARTARVQPCTSCGNSLSNGVRHPRRLPHCQDRPVAPDASRNHPRVSRLDRQLAPWPLGTKSPPMAHTGIPWPWWCSPFLQPGWVEHSVHGAGASPATHPKHAASGFPPSPAIT